MLNLQEGGRLDAKRHYVKAQDGIWPVGHACAVLCLGTAAAGSSAQHCTAMTNWPNTIKCLGSDDMMSLGIKSSAIFQFPPQTNCAFGMRGTGAAGSNH